MTQYVVIVRLEAQPDKIEAVKQALIAVLTPSKAEDICVAYQLHQDVNDPVKFMLYEVWESQEAHAIHATQPYVREFANTVPPLLAKPWEISFFNQVA